MNKTTVVVTGATKAGIGEAITRRLLSEGLNVIGTFNSEEVNPAKTLETEFQSTGRLKLFEVDFSSRRSLSSFVESLNSDIRGFVNAEFFFAMEDPEDFDHDLWDKSITINLTAPNFLVHKLKPKLTDGGSIVIITSTEGYVGSFGASAYGATKAAIHNLVKSLANNFGHRNIRINALAPGWIGGVMDTDEVFNISRRITPLGRLGSPSEIAAAASFLLSDQSSFINGTVLVADGGYTGVDTIAKYEFEQSRKK